MAPKINSPILIVCCVLIAAISAFDAYLAVLYSNVLVELNPIARWLIAKGGIPLLVAFKLFGTACALALMVEYRKHRLASPIIIGSTICQLLLLWYLTCS